MFCSKANFKIEEVVPKHKFDDVYLEDFKQHDLKTKIKNVFVFVTVVWIIVIHVADVWIATLLMFDSKVASTQPKVSLNVSKLIYGGCLATSHLLLTLDWKKSKAIIDSNDIGYAFTNPIAFRYHSLKSYLHHCFFCNISKKNALVDDVTFFVFSALKGWRRLIIFEAPRQIVNAITLFSIANSNVSFGNNITERLSIALMTMTFLNFFTRASFLAVAFMLYMLLTLRINENLREYFYHKVDQKIDELLEGQHHKHELKQQKISQVVKENNIFRLREALKEDLSIIHPMISKKHSSYVDEDDSDVKEYAPPVINITFSEGDGALESRSPPINFDRLSNSSSPQSQPFPVRTSTSSKMKKPNSSSPYYSPYPLNPTPRTSYSSRSHNSSLSSPPSQINSSGPLYDYNIDEDTYVDRW
ncbi:7565_t:CDS:2 [Funneliformis mosseae]|uniref:7565_t:CDS:1 n=1 Tax=Funneliformis mosseae TaxID=27381 RepID=A0A9N9EIT4_FUNMO|nr:7565_t:CDS:2 [Funneliformis mosseae]